jgi:hypothetical protein
MSKEEIRKAVQKLLEQGEEMPPIDWGEEPKPKPGLRRQRGRAARTVEQCIWEGIFAALVEEPDIIDRIYELADSVSDEGIEREEFNLVYDRVVTHMLR